MINWLLALLVIDGRLTHDQAEALSHILPRTTHPENVFQAETIIRQILKDPTKAKLEKT